MNGACAIELLTRRLLECRYLTYPCHRFIRFVLGADQRRDSDNRLESPLSAVGTAIR